MSIEAMKLALEALDDINSLLTTMTGASFTKLEHAAASLRQAIEQAQKQEPVAWATQLGEYAHIQWGSKRPEYPVVYEVPLYTSPPQRQPLTDEGIAYATAPVFMGGNPSLTAIARAIEAAHGIKGEA